MNKGITSFNGTRLADAREIMGITGDELAEAIDVSRQMVSKYENNHANPTSDTLELLSKELKMPKHYFLNDEISTTKDVVFYRSLASATIRARNRSEIKLKWLKQIIDLISNYIVIPKFNIPFPVISNRPLDYDLESIENAASQIRSSFGLELGPIPNLSKHIEKSGIILAKAELGSERLDAFSEWSSLDGRPYIFLGKDKRNAPRSRFDLAHELAHIILHKKIKKSDFNKKANFKTLEDQANRFAGALLLPAEGFTRDFQTPSLENFLAIKEKWKVSLAFMIKRSSDLGLLTERYERTLWINYSRKGWRKGEPLDDKIEAEFPSFLQKSIKLLINEEIMSPSEIVDRISLPPHYIEELTNLEIGYFSKLMNKDVIPKLINIKRN